jgi:hypothetical protein
MDSTLTLTVPSSLRQAIDEVARSQGTTVESLAARVLRERFAPADDHDPVVDDEGGTLADLLAEHVGVLDSGELVPGGARMSERRKDYADMLLRDHRGRRL